MPWKLERSYFEMCSRHVVCPCTASLALVRPSTVAGSRWYSTSGKELWRGRTWAGEVHEDGLRHSIRIGDAFDFEVEEVVPFGVESWEPAHRTGIFHPAGSELTIANARRSKIDASGIQYDGKGAFSTSSFSWSA